MWWKLSALGLLAVGLAAFLFAPIETVDIRVDLPAPADAEGVSGADARLMLLPMQIAVGVLSAIILGVLGLIGWVMWRVVRHHRGGKAPRDAR